MESGDRGVHCDGDILRHAMDDALAGQFGEADLIVFTGDTDDDGRMSGEKRIRRDASARGAVDLREGAGTVFEGDVFATMLWPLEQPQSYGSEDQKHQAVVAMILVRFFCCFQPGRAISITRNPSHGNLAVLLPKLRHTNAG